MQRILFITLSNFGDVILTLPALDLIRESYPGCRITVMAGPRVAEIFRNNPHISRLIIYDKHSRLREKIKLFFQLSRDKYDAVIDYRNSFYGALLPAARRTSPFLFISKDIKHMKERNLLRLKYALGIEPRLCKPASLDIKPQDNTYIEGLLKRSGVQEKDKLVIISAGTGGHTRRWSTENFARLCEQLEGAGLKPLLIGSKEHKELSQKIISLSRVKPADFTGLTDLSQLCALLLRASCMVSCDTGTLQLGSYLNVPMVTLFGPSDDGKYGPWPQVKKVLKKEISCRPCQAALCAREDIACMQLISVERVFSAIKEVLAGKVTTMEQPYKRILVSRTDRIGDVVLSTPALRALRRAYPDAYIAAMVSPYARDIVENSPFVDEVIVFDKDKEHKGFLGTLKFVSLLKKGKFDLAVILHPANRVHIAAFLAGIKKRLGYDKKMGFLLTDRVRHIKQHGQMHEAEFNLRLLRQLGIEAADKTPFLALNETASRKIEALFAKEGLNGKRVVGIHPGASCPSKIWPAERFAQLAGLIAEKFGAKIIIVAGAKDADTARRMLDNLRVPALDLCAKTSVGELACVLQRCELFISNDSGPVHIATAVGTPVISIFGRNEPGLGPKRWGPLGKRDSVLQKDVGCKPQECLAHNCTKGFACLTALSVEEVFAVVEKSLNVMRSETKDHK